MKTPLFVFRARRWLRRRDVALVVLLGLIVVFAGLLFLLMGENGAGAPGAETAAVQAPRGPDQAVAKIETRTEAAISAEARAVADLSHLQAFDLPPPLQSIDGLSFRRGDEVVRLDGVEGPGPEDVCLDAAGRRWSCGLQARAALHNLTAGQTLQCRPRSVLSQDVIAAACVMTRKDGSPEEDLAAALVKLGWARARGAAPGAYGREAEQAQAGQLGLWRGGWTIVTSR